MRHRTVLILAMILGFALFGLTPRRTLSQAAGAGAAASESHEGVTISAQPWTEPATYKPKFPKKNPLSAGVIAIQVVIQNDSPETVRVNLDRIRMVVTLDENARQNLPALSSEDVADLVLRSKARDPSPTRPKIPIPIGKPKGSRNKEWMEFEQAARDAGVPSSVVPAHGKLQGLLYFDLGGQFDLLRTARLYLPEVTNLEKGRSLLYFEIDLSNARPQ
jgi:hypothetical protein